MKSKSYIKKLFILLSSCIVLVGCTNPTITSISTTEGVNQSRDIYQSLSITPQPNNQLCWYSDEYFVDRWEEATENTFFTSGLLNGLMIQNGTLIGQETYQIAPQIAVNLTYRGYFYAQEVANMTVRYVAFLNETQLTTPFDGIDTPYRDMTFDYKQTQSFNMTIPALNEGIHELVLIGIEQVDILADGSAGVFPIRLTLVVGNPPLLVDNSKYENIQPTELRTDSNQNIFWSLSLNREPSHVGWDETNIYKAVSNRLDFYMSVGYMEQSDKLAEHNITPQPQPIALIALLDYVQVPIQTDKLVFYGLLMPDNAHSFIPGNIDMRDYSGKKELLVIQINYLRIPICLLIPPPTEQIGYFFYFTIDVKRHGVDVQNE